MPTRDTPHSAPDVLVVALLDLNVQWVIKTLSLAVLSNKYETPTQINTCGDVPTVAQLFTIT